MLQARGSIIGSIVGILLCGIAGGFGAWMIVAMMGIDGVTGAFIAAVIGMVVATALWAGGTALLRALRWIQ
jgi:hypothetical protein